MSPCRVGAECLRCILAAPRRAKAPPLAPSERAAPTKRVDCNCVEYARRDRAFALARPTGAAVATAFVRWLHRARLSLDRTWPHPRIANRRGLCFGCRQAPRRWQRSLWLTPRRCLRRLRAAQLKQQTHSRELRRIGKVPSRAPGTARAGVSRRRRRSRHC